MGTSSKHGLPDIPGHNDYKIVPDNRPNNDCYECECGWISNGYHDMTTYAYLDWVEHRNSFVSCQEKRCGTCKHFVLGQRGYCEYPLPEEIAKQLPASVNKNAVWVNDGKNCNVWEKN